MDFTIQKLLLFVIIILAISVYVYALLKTKKKIESVLIEIEKYKPTLNSYIDLRFAAYEKLIATTEKLIPLNETFFKDVVQLRTESHAARVSGNQIREFNAESKISLVSKNLTKITGDYKELSGNKDVNKFIKAVMVQEEELQEVILKYNILLDEYHTLIFGVPGNMVVKIFKDLRKDLPYNR